MSDAYAELQEALQGARAQRKAEAEAAELRKASGGAGGRLTCKVSQKGAVSVYELGRWPVTLYAGQWERLAEFVPTVLRFVEERRGELSTK